MTVSRWRCGEEGFVVVVRVEVGEKGKRGRRISWAAHPPSL
jgi:hypothetical protein